MFVSMLIVNPTYSFNAFFDKHHVDIKSKHDYGYQYAIYNNCQQRLMLQYADTVSSGGFCLFWTFTFTDKALPKSFGYSCCSSRLTRLFTNSLQNWCNRRSVSLKFAFFTEYESSGKRLVHPHNHALLFFSPRVSSFDLETFKDDVYVKLFRYFQGDYWYIKNLGSRDYSTGFSAAWFTEHGFKLTTTPQFDFPVGMCNSSRDMGVLLSSAGVRYCTKYLLKHSFTYDSVEYNSNFLDKYDAYVRSNFERVFLSLYGSNSRFVVKEYLSKFLRRLHFKYFYRYKLSKNLGLQSFLNGNADFKINAFDPFNPTLNLQVSESQFQRFPLSPYYFSKAYKTSIRQFKDDSKTDKVYRQFYNDDYEKYVRSSFDSTIKYFINKFDSILSLELPPNARSLTDFGLSFISPALLKKSVYYRVCLRYKLIPRYDCDFPDFNRRIRCINSSWFTNVRDYYFSTLRTLNNFKNLLSYDETSSTYLCPDFSFPYVSSDPYFIDSAVAFPLFERVNCFFDNILSALAKTKKIDRSSLDDGFIELSKY